MRTVQEGDCVCVHYVKRTQNGLSASSHGRAPLEVTVGTEHRRLPGLGLALVGLGEGQRVMVVVPPEQAYGQPRPERVRRLSRTRFPQEQVLEPGSRVRLTDRRGRRRQVRIVEVREKVVVVDANHPLAGQAVALEVEIVSIRSGAVSSDKEALPGMPGQER